MQPISGVPMLIRKAGRPSEKAFSKASEGRRDTPSAIPRKCAWSGVITTSKACLRDRAPAFKPLFCKFNLSRQTKAGSTRSWPKRLRGAPAAALANGFASKQGLGLARPSSLSDKGTGICRKAWPSGDLMRKPFSWICGILAVLASQPANSATSAAASGPDFNLAYVLATASYCAYAVGAIDSDGERLADQGRQRASDCLTAAVAADPSRLAALKVGVADVEAYFRPAKPQNAYLLIRAKDGVIIAFRGTLTLPISPGKARHNGLVREAIDNFNVAVLKAFESYLRDWANNVVAFADERDRHAGFDHS